MNRESSIDQLVDRVCRHWEARRRAAAAQTAQSVPAPVGFSITIARDAETPSHEVAHEVADRLGWPVYDHELLEKIAREMGLRARLLESVDERRMSWVEEAMEAFGSVPTVSESAYVQQLIRTLLALGAHGECVIVGRGAAHVLPPDTTLRVRLVAPLKDRVAARSQRLGVPREIASRQIRGEDLERTRFIQDHFLKNPLDPRHYDLVLNTVRFSVADCADLILDGLRRLQTRVGTHGLAAAAR